MPTKEACESRFFATITSVTRDALCGYARPAPRPGQNAPTAVRVQSAGANKSQLAVVAALLPARVELRLSAAEPYDAATKKHAAGYVVAAAHFKERGNHLRT